MIRTSEQTNELDQLAKSEVPASAPKNLVQKLCEVMAAIGYIAKKGENKFHGYKYAKESDIVDAIRGELAQRNLFIFPSVTTHARSGEITDIMVRWTFTDGDSGEQRDCDIPGCGQDKGDKGVYKALTGSEKYFLMKTFLIPTGDDPEADSKAEQEDARGAAQAVGKAKMAALKEKLGKSPADGQGQPVTTLFWTAPDKYNGHRAVFLNLREFGAGLNEVAAEGLKQVLK